MSKDNNLCNRESKIKEINAFFDTIIEQFAENINCKRKEIIKKINDINEPENTYYDLANIGKLQCAFKTKENQQELIVTLKDIISE